MKTTITTALCVIALLIPTRHTHGMNDAIIAVVNDHVITLKELRDHLGSVYMQMTASGEDPDAVERFMHAYEPQALEKVIERKLLVDEANKKGLIINQRAIEERLNQVRAHYDSDQQFREALREDGLTVTDLINSITDQLKVRSIVDVEIRSVISVSPQEVTEYYREHADAFSMPERIDLDSIFISYTDNADAAEAMAREAFEELVNKNRSFAEVAQHYSKMPSIGIIARGQALPAIEGVVFILEEGSISEPIKTATGIFILKVKTRYPPQQVPLEEARERIVATISEEKFNERMERWLAELKSRAYIEIKN